MPLDITLKNTKKYITPINIFILVIVLITIYYAYKYYKNNCSLERYNNIQNKVIRETTAAVTINNNLISNLFRRLNQNLNNKNNHNYITTIENAKYNLYFNIDKLEFNINNDGTLSLKPTIGNLMMLDNNNVSKPYDKNPIPYECSLIINKNGDKYTAQKLYKYKNNLSGYNDGNRYTQPIDITTEVNAIINEFNMAFNTSDKRWGWTVNANIDSISGNLSFFINDKTTNTKNKYINFTNISNNNTFIITSVLL